MTRSNRQRLLARRRFCAFARPSRANPSSRAISPGCGVIASMPLRHYLIQGRVLRMHSSRRHREQWERIDRRQRRGQIAAFRGCVESRGRLRARASLSEPIRKADFRRRDRNAVRCPSQGDGTVMISGVCARQVGNAGSGIAAVTSPRPLAKPPTKPEPPRHFCPESRQRLARGRNRPCSRRLGAARKIRKLVRFAPTQIALANFLDQFRRRADIAHQQAAPTNSPASPATCPASAR